MADKRDYYEVLGLKKGASDDEIKRAYRRLAGQNHPDVNPGDKSAEERFKEIGEAYEVLSDADKKSRYDAYGHAGVDPSYGGGGGASSPFGGGFNDFDLGSIFESFFGGGGGARRGPMRGEHIRTSARISFEQAAFGVTETVRVSRIEHCSDCEGTGASPGTHAETCKACGGTGQTATVRRTPLGQVRSVETCTACKGRGKTVSSPCKTCDGLGRVRKNRDIQVNIPAGIDDGQTVQLRGEGHAGAEGAPSGDLYVTVDVRPHPVFTRDGTSVMCDVPISMTDAALGAEIEVPTLDGRVSYTIPEGTQSGTVFRLKGKGIVRIHTNQRGDQYVRVSVEIPKGLNEKQKELLRQLAETMGEKSAKKPFFKKK